eukprot:scaffold48605_cov18-Tisochrysis_lutea.AAC.1
MGEAIASSPARDPFLNARSRTWRVQTLFFSSCIGALSPFQCTVPAVGALCLLLVQCVYCWCTVSAVGALCLPLVHCVRCWCTVSAVGALCLLMCTVSAPSPGSSAPEFAVLACMPGKHTPPARPTGHASKKPPSACGAPSGRARTANAAAPQL